VHGESSFIGVAFTITSRWLPYPIALDSHMLAMASQNRGRHLFRLFYKAAISPIILKRKIPFIRVVDSDFVEKHLGIPLQNTKLLPLGTDTDTFRPNIEEKLKARQKLGIDPDTFVVLYAGKLDQEKGGDFLAETILDEINLQSGRKIAFIIIGNTVGDYGSKVEAKLKSSMNKVLRFPTQKYYDLLGFYQTSDLALYPRQCSMSFFEAQACGLPVLFEENEINKTRLSGKNAFLFQPGSCTDLREKIIRLASMDKHEFKLCGDSARRFVEANFNFVPTSHKYTELLSETSIAWQRNNRK
jgi:glycosyltransferase involved in cell wall biosynthesis